MYTCHSLYALVQEAMIGKFARKNDWGNIGVSMGIKFEGRLGDIGSPYNLLLAWEEFLPGKRAKLDVQDFNLRLMDNIIQLSQEIVNGAYRHGGYETFNIADPKPRNIHKASVRDRLVHHAAYRILYPFFDRVFIPDSFSCRRGKGTHAAMQRFRTFAYGVSRNNTRTCWVLKCDIRKFFASIDHRVLMDILAKRISDDGMQALLGEIIGSFSTPDRPGVGLPLGNLTSQLLVNIYMNEFDQFVKHVLHFPYYIRYADDFVFLSDDRRQLETLLPEVRTFLTDHLRLELHPDKVSIATVASGIDFLGWVHFPDHRVLRATTRRRMLLRLFHRIDGQDASNATMQSYRGLLRHGNTEKISSKINKLNVHREMI